MFLNTSRYAKTPTVTITLGDGTQVSAVKLRTIPATASTSTQVTQNDRLDILAERSYGDSTRYWHIADANTELDSNALLKQWLDGDRTAQPLHIGIPGS
jgi:hypothetical protein